MDDGLAYVICKVCFGLDGLFNSHRSPFSLSHASHPHLWLLALLLLLPLS